jgi:hypothetical protein
MALLAGASIAAVPLRGNGEKPFAAGPRVFQGSANGVSVTLTVPRSSRLSSKLTFHFGTAGDSAWRRALAAGKLEAFCIWPEPAHGGGGASTNDVTLDKAHRTQTFAVTPSQSASSYTCGLHVRIEGPQDGWPFSGYVRHALVAARLKTVHH